jgi:uncharacterized SAM-binding protein YcdF (DUF218 family)
LRLHLPKRKSTWLLLACAAAFVAYVGADFVRIARQARIDEARPADVIIVFGAAEYSGRPSPVFRARLEHGLALYRRGLAPRIIVTGGPGGEIEFTEGAVGRDYLVRSGVPEAVVIAETISKDTSDSAARVATIMRTNGMKTCVAVSDAFHLYRIKRMLTAEGVETYASPRSGKLLNRRQKVALYLREVLSLTLWRLGVK